jgi:PDZ domain-containing protein
VAHRCAGLIVLVLAAAARADDACDTERWRTGLAVAGADAGVSVAAIEDASPAAAGGLRAGDVVVQVNGVVPRGCGDWARAVRDARRERKALLLLVRRAGGELPLVVSAASWDRTPVAPVADAKPPPPGEPPSVRELVAGAAPALPAASQVDVGQVVQDVTRLGGGRTTRAAYRAELARLHAAVRGLGTRGDVPRDVVAGIETVLRYHDAAAVAWDSEDAARERERRSSRLPTPDAMTAPFFTDSEEESAIEAFPFLRATVARQPAPGVIGESAGLWRPVEARKALWDAARTEQDRLSGWLGMAGR